TPINIYAARPKFPNSLLLRPAAQSALSVIRHTFCKRSPRTSCNFFRTYYILWSCLTALQRGLPMQTAADVLSVSSSASGGLHSIEGGRVAPAAHSQHRLIRRNGAVVAFEPSKISVAMTKAFLAVEGGQGAASARIRELVSG